MIEIIREEDWDSTTNCEDRGDSKETADGENRVRKEALPKDIKQIGRPDIGDRIYVEDQVYHFIHPFESQGEKIAYVLLGRFENYAGRQCTFIEAAIRLDEVEFEGDLPLWSDHTWAYIYKQLKKEHDSMVIVGWVMDIKGQLPNMTVRLEALHQKNFGGIHQVLFLMDTLEGEEAFYGSRNGHLYRREGFYIYYDKNIPSDLNMAMQELREEQGPVMREVSDSLEQKIGKELVFGQESEENQILEESKTLEESKAFEDTDSTGESAFWDKTPLRRGNYRRQIVEKEEKQPITSYASSLILLAVVCVLGITAFQNYRKMDAMEETLAQMRPASNVAATEQATETESTGIKVESVAGNVQLPENQPETPVQDAAQGAAETNPAPEDGSQQPPADSAATPDQTAVPDQAADISSDGTSVVPPAQPQAENPQDASSDTSQPAAAQNGDTPASAEAQTYLGQGYYIVQKGDSLVGICRKIYQTTAMMDKLCEVNGIENKDAIFAGQYLTLPN